MTTMSASTSLEKLMLPEAARNDLSKPSRQIFWEHRKCISLCLIIHACSFFTGYETVISSSFINYASFINKFGVAFHGRKEIDVQFQQNIRIASIFGSLAANSVQWWISQRYMGRIRLAQAGLTLAIVSIVMQLAANNRQTYAAATFFMGFSDAVVRYAIFLWVAESTVARIRGACSGIGQIKWGVGALIGQGVSRVYSTGSSSMHYKAPLLIALGPQVISVIALFLLPESPRWLLMQDRLDEARASLRRLRSGEHLTESAIDSEIAAIQAALRLEKETQAKHQSMVSDSPDGANSIISKVKKLHIYGALVGTNKKRTLVCALAGTFYVASGHDFAVTGQPYILRVFGEHDPFKYAIIVSTCCLLGAILNVAYFAESMARRKLVLGGFFVSGMSMLAIGIAFVLPDVALAKRRLVLTAFASVVGFCDSASVSNIALAIANEIPAQEYRSASMVYHWVTYFVATAVHDVVQPYWINVTSLNLGGKIAWLYFVTCFLSIVACYLIIPESRGCTLEEMDLLWNAKISPRKSAQWIQEHRSKILEGQENVSAAKTEAEPKAGDEAEKEPTT